MLRLLVANRGEIAVRVIRACRELSISPLAVYSEADRDALHVSLADEAVCIGSPPPAESYLNLPSIIAAAKQLRADAIHPGYGFLSESPSLPEACEREGIAFLGPPAEVMRALGDKIEAKRLAEKSGVPVVPGYHGESQSDRRLSAAASEAGFPVLVKAAAGGGGRGMRVARTAEELSASLREARAEARAGFGDDRLLLERYVERPRHIEVQILGDRHGNVVHLFERECSLQRRHQKVIEESPSPVLTSNLRSAITEAAARLARAANYESAGTVEFLFEEMPDGNHRYYFLEANARLQVEHPVTEMVTGIDLVREQIAVARGEPLRFRQEAIQTAGHAIEARITAEDASADFLPSTGTIATWIEPRGPGIRVDSGFGSGHAVPPDYDSLLAKLICRTGDRGSAIERLWAALREFHVLGVSTSIPFLLDVVADSEFAAGRLHTGFIAERFPGWRQSPDVPDEVLVAAAHVLTSGNRSSLPRREKPDPWHDASGWRIG